MNRILHNINPYESVVGEIGTTTRYGTKWQSVKEGEIIDICFCPDVNNHSIIGTGEVLKTRWIGKIKDIPIDLIEKEHDRLSRTYLDLLKEMKAAYEDFDEDNIVFVFEYKRIS